MTASLVVVGVALLCALYVAWLAARLSRLHRRVAATRRALEEARLERARAALALVAGDGDPSALALGEAAQASLAAPLGSWESSENEMTKRLREALATPVGARPGGEEVRSAHRRLTLARQVYNDAVRDTVALQGRRLPRALRLSIPFGRPPYFDISTELGPEVGSGA